MTAREQLSVASSQLSENGSQSSVASNELGDEAQPAVTNGTGFIHSYDGNTGGEEAEQYETAGGTKCRLTEEDVRELTEFATREPESQGPPSAQQKRLAAQRKLVEGDLARLRKYGDVLDTFDERFKLTEGGRSRWVPPREFLMLNWVKIRDKRGRLQSFAMNAVQRDYWRSAAKRSIVLKARQLGISTYVAARFFLNCITRPGTLVMQVAHDQRSAEQIFRIVHRMLANLPEQYRRGALKTSHANVRQIVFPHLDSQYRVATASDLNAGRGMTIQNLHCSEVARWPGNASETLASLRAAVPPDGEIVLESTANGACGLFYEEWQSAEEKGYSRHFYPWWWEPSYKKRVKAAELTGEELELMTKHQLTAQQIAFRREMRANFGKRMEEEFAEDAESCFLASSECIFNLDIVERRLHETADAKAWKESGKTWTFLPAQRDKRYVIGVDPAGGGSRGDYACAQVIDRATGMQCAELRGHLTPHELAKQVVDLAWEYNQAEVAVERNNHGHTVLHVLENEFSGVPLFRHEGKPGWLTNKATRPLMLDNLAEVLKDNPRLFMSPRLLEECKTFVKRPDGNKAAANGAHDDTVMAMAIAQVVRTEEAGHCREVATVSLSGEKVISNS